MIKYPFKIEKMNDDGEYYLVTSLNFSGGVTQGETMEEAIANAIDVLDLLLADALEHDKLEEPKKVKGKNIHYIAPSLEYAIPILLRKAREERKLSTPQVAKAMGVPYQNYWRIEKGQRKNLTIGTVQRAAAVLGFTIDVSLVE
ncbi:helix-turn-helix domain-containing protein [Thiotrichales bacterium 19X7-9]|nr:helix-turn-helix domain-containing protein [Thiotrichales bacterium 19X7-9]